MIALRIAPLGPPQFQNGVLRQNWPTIGRDMADRQRPKIKDFLKNKKISLKVTAKFCFAPWVPFETF